jgi:hypothetical protein
VAKVQSGSFAKPDEVRTLEHGRIELVTLGDMTVGRQVLEPGWRWSTHVRPLAGTLTCEYHHLGLVLSGRMHIEMNDGTVMELGPDAVYEIPPGHDAWVIGDEPWTGINWAGIRTYGAPLLATSERILTTVLFTDIVGSTDVAARIGDGRWQTLLAAHNDAVRHAIDRFGGVEVKTTGDGFLVRFDAPARALACARAIRTAVASLDLRIRAAVHTGEVEVVGDDTRAGRRLRARLRGPWPPRAQGDRRRSRGVCARGRLTVRSVGAAAGARRARGRVPPPARHEASRGQSGGGDPRS